VTQELWDLYEGEEIDIPTLPEYLDEAYSQMDRWLNCVHGTEDEPLLTDPDSLRAMRRAYYGLVTYIDRKVGDLMDALERTGLSDNTIVVFTSDHGDMLGEKRMVQKRCFYEWSARIPLIVGYPDGSHAGKAIRAPVSFFDLMPTTLDWAGVPEEERLPVDAESLTPLLADDDKERVVISEFHADKVKAPCFMVRQWPYKYIYVHGHEPQLFNLESDPGEWHSLAGHPDVADDEAGLRAKIFERFDPDAVAADVLDSVHRREIIKEAMIRSDTHWDYEPRFDATSSYVRRG
jgi:choline-sulfatase